MTKKARLKRKVLRLLPLNKLNTFDHPSGCFGTYIKLSDKVGIKIISSITEREKNRHFYRIYTRMEKEARMMRKVRRCFGLVPRCYGTLIFKDLNDRYRMGILMQHIGEDTLWGISRKEGLSTLSEIEGRIEESLRKRKFCHGDLHSKNIMYFKGQFWPIDFTDVFHIK